MSEKIIVAEKNHLEDFLIMSSELWKEDYNTEEMTSFFIDCCNSKKKRILFFVKDTHIAAFIYLSIRVDYVEGSDSSPTGYIEGIYVKPGFRKHGTARKLLAEGELWLKENGCKQIGSDAYIDNKESYDFHLRVGFKEAGKLVTFIKDL